MSARCGGLSSSPAAFFGLNVGEEARSLHSSAGRSRHPHPRDMGEDRAHHRVPGGSSSVKPSRSALAMRPARIPTAARFYIALAASDLSGETQARHHLHLQAFVQHFWRVDKGVAVKFASLANSAFSSPVSFSARGFVRRISSWSGNRPCYRAYRARYPDGAG